MKLLLMGYLIVIQVITCDKVDWCALSCENGEKNTMCIYKPQTNGGNCDKIQTATDKVLRRNILHKHNEYRNRLANGGISSNGTVWPKASNMLQMSWDYDLEQLALRWAQQCSLSPFHDTCRRTPVFHRTGQNKGLESQPHLFPSAELNFVDWTAGIQYTTVGDVDNLNSLEGLEFTQVIWAETYKLGCAAIHSISKAIKTSTLVCNYGPTGNKGGEKIYQRGDPCTSCPSSTSCQKGSAYPHLCARKGEARIPEDIPDNIHSSSSGRLKLLGMPPEEFKTLVIAILTFRFYKIILK